MKIATYNIMSGGFDSYISKSARPERIEIIKKAIKKINADFISLIDTFRWDKIYTPKDLQNLFGYKNCFSINLNDSRLKKLGHNNGITVLTNLGNVKFKKIRLFNRNAIESQILINKEIINIYSVYLDDLSENTRMKQVKDLLKISRKEKNKIIMGDFNTIDKKYLLAASNGMNKFILNNSNSASKFNPIFEEMKKVQALEILRKNNYADIIEKYSPNVATKLSHAKLSPAKLKKPFIRLDYIFRTSDIKVKNSHVLYDVIFDKASDHYPISAEVYL
jgi:endonuclease/exonuclease/phosphatase family metal-dependent hydrolase